MFQNTFSLKPLGQLKLNCRGMNIGRSYANFLFFMSIGNPKWPPPQDIDCCTLWENVQMPSQKLQIWSKLNCTWMFIGLSSTSFMCFCSDMKFKMTATAGLSLTLDPMGKMFQNTFSQKPLGQLKPNCPGMIIGRSSTNFMFFMSIGNPRWPPPQDID